MAIHLTIEDHKEVAERTRNDPQVIVSFYEWYGLYKQQFQDDRTACKLALQKRNEVYQEIFQQKLEEYETEIGRNYGIRLLSLKKWKTGKTFLTKSGIRVRSKIEKIIADFLYYNKIRFTYEPMVNLGGFYLIPDFHLDDYDIILEHFGLENQEYKQCVQSKLNRYKYFKIKVVCTYASEETDIVEVLIRKLSEAGVPVQS